ncbi:MULTISPECIES: hypothetical protein [Actinomadura]|uniref:Uncharacterized protein n=1 Tax=Actinomadura litoris TaxID=2678616 RepID=A0A7K1LCR3_9ACTN|nr:MULTISPECIES: hypothetical protein [Actinomadura]MBT2214035.1 hypothetical protein [Actinomadura sp. NEAU-AAG7]MUN42220.1 hypothetical protein [Actinomadura litoris]
MHIPALRLGARARFWRSAVAAAGIAALFYTSAYGADDDFPFGPMTQFAFSVKNDGGEIVSHWLEADTATGAHVKLSMDAVGSGMKRAEIEGQMTRLGRDPSLLQGIAEGQHRLHPKEPRLTRIYIVKQVQTLKHGKVVSTTRANAVVWGVR